MIKIDSEAADIIYTISQATSKSLKDVASTIIKQAVELNLIEMIEGEEPAAQ